MPVSKNRKKRSNIQRIPVYITVQGKDRRRRSTLKLIGYKFIKHYNQ
jgi:hypothetical protein